MVGMAVLCQYSSRAGKEPGKLTGNLVLAQVVRVDLDIASPGARGLLHVEAAVDHLGDLLASAIDIELELLGLVLLVAGGAVVAFEGHVVLALGVGLCRRGNVSNVSRKERQGCSHHQLRRLR